MTQGDSHEGPLRCPPPHTVCSCLLARAVEAGQVEAENQEPGLNALHCLEGLEEGAAPRAQACPAAQTQGCPGAPQSRKEA